MAKMWAHVGSKMAKKAISSTLGKLKDKLTGLHKTLQKFIFY